MSLDKDYSIESELEKALKVIKLLCSRMGIDEAPETTESEDASDNN